MTEQDAMRRGYTQEVFAESDGPVLHILIRPDTDLDGTFSAWCMDEGEMLSVNGWLFTIVESLDA